MTMPVVDIWCMCMLVFKPCMAMLVRVRAIHKWDILLTGMIMMLVGM